MRRAIRGFSVDQPVFLAAGDQSGIERLIQYMTPCPFSLSGHMFSFGGRDR
jgi:hypothetical protein